MLTHNPYAKTNGSSTTSSRQSGQDQAKTKPLETKKQLPSPMINPYVKSQTITSAVDASGAPKRPAMMPLQDNRQNAESTKKSRLATTSIRPPSWNNSELQQRHNLSQSQPPKGIELPGEEVLPKEISYSSSDIKPIDDGYRRDLVTNANIREPLLNGWTLYPHQKQSVLQSLVKRRMILALDMGLGKTLIGCVWAKSFKMTFDRLKILVICPVSLKTEWKRTAENATGLTVEDEKASTNKKSLDLRICSWAKVPTKVDSSVKHYVAVFDEAHSMQSMQAGRTKDALKLVLDERCVGVLLLSGTPMKNGKPGNLFPLLKAIQHPLGKNQMAYETHFCAGMHKNFGRGRPVWDASGCSNLKQLKRLVSSNLLHLTKDQCLSLPPFEREQYRVPISARNQLQYSQAVKNLASLQAASKEKDDLGEAVLGGMQKLRSLCSFSKIGPTVELAKRILDKEPSVVIFTCFAKVAKSIHRQLASSGWDGEVLTGETPQKKRQSMVDNFQNGNAAVFVCTFGAGGVGLTLTAASSIILLDRPWTPGETRQAEDRIRRIGQNKNCKSYWMSGFEIDTQIDDMILSKEEASKAVLSKGNTTSVNLAAKINIQRLLESLVAKVS